MIKDYFLWLLKFITVLLVLIIGLPLIMMAVGAAISAMGGAPEAVGNKVAVVELSGVIYDSKEVVEELYRQSNSPAIDGVVLRIDSPGGAVAPSQEIYETVSRLKNKKPIVVSMGSVAASGGLYSALGASKIYAQPGTLTGSIGVILEIPNIKGISEKVGFSMNTIKSGALKDAGNMFRDMSEEERLYLEKVASDTHQDFISAVAKGRNLDLGKVKEFSDGRVIIGREALSLGLIDGLGDVYDAAREVYVILGKPLAADKEVKLYYPQEKFKEFRDLLKGTSSLVKALPLSPQIKYQWQ